MMPSRNPLNEFLVSYDADERPGRSSRLGFIINVFGEERGILLPQMAYSYLNEIKICFIYGAFLSCLIVTLAALEDLLKFFYDPKTAYFELSKIGLAKMTSKAVTDGFISAEEGDVIHELRKYRNFYVHSKHCTRPESFMNRLEARGFELTKDELIREDAEKAVAFFFGLLDKHPFTLKPNS